MNRIRTVQKRVSLNLANELETIKAKYGRSGIKITDGDASELLLKKRYKKLIWIKEEL